MSGELVSSEGQGKDLFQVALFGLQMAVLWLSLHMVALLCTRALVSLYAHIASPHKDSSWIGVGPTLTAILT